MIRGLFKNEKGLNELETKLRAEMEEKLELQRKEKDTEIEALKLTNEKVHNELLEKNELIKNIKREIAETNLFLTKDIEDINNSISSIASISEEHGATMEELTSTVGNIMERVNMAHDGAINNSGVMTKFNDDFIQIYQEADELNAKAKDINKIIDTIEAIANQTNLLSLNASIESARAGESGKGFAVVASEIRKLAEQTKISNADIKRIIKELQDRVLEILTKVSEGKDNSKKLTDSNVFRIENITIIKDGFTDVYASFEQITSASQEQSANIVETANKIDEITNKITKE
jgi:methyl-accepting chemotaxis protein